MLKINSSGRAAKFLLKLPTKHAKQIVRKTSLLCFNAFPNDSKKINNTDCFRVDCGEYRIIYRVHNNEIFIITIGKRNDGEVYKQLFRME